jgi:hypothetical protein
MADSAAGPEAIAFNIHDDSDFTRWVKPILNHLVVYGRIPRPAQLTPVIRQFFHQVMERMIRGSFNTMLNYLRDNVSRTVLASIMTVNERRRVLERIRETWPEVVTRGLELYGWTAPEHVAEYRAAIDQAQAQTLARRTSMQTFRPQQTYYRPEVQAVVRQEVSLAEALEEFEKLTLHEVRLTLEGREQQHGGDSDAMGEFDVQDQIL